MNVKVSTIVKEWGPEVGAMVELGLTPTQARMLLFLFAETIRQGYQPSGREIALEFGFSSQTGTVSHLVGLRRKGWIGSCQHSGRAIRFLRNPDGSPFRGFLLQPAGHGKQEA